MALSGLNPRHGYVPQIIPSREEVDRLFKYKKGMLIPMYDSVVLNNNVDWINFGDFKVLCFCQKLLHILELRGFDVFYIQFFPPSAILYIALTIVLTIFALSV